jgi:formate-dependent nitrite reductase membrane component NrfD
MWPLITGVTGIFAGCAAYLVIMVIRASARLAVKRLHVTEAALDDAELAMYGALRHRGGEGW